MSEQPRPLSGMRVVELAHHGWPLCGMMLADMGADVIKVEKLDGGDDSRRMVPPKVDNESAAFLMMNRNKRGVALDLKSEKGKEVLADLLKHADCVIENFRHDTMKRLGLSFEDLKSINQVLSMLKFPDTAEQGPIVSERASIWLLRAQVG